MNLTIVIILNFCAILINGIPDYNRIVEMLLKDGPNVNNQNEDGRTALFRASQDGHTDAVEFLIKNGADINLKDKFGSSPLYAASESGYKRVVEILITNGALVNIKKKDGWTPLMAAAQEGHEQVIEVLHKNGANVNDQNSAEETALYVALSRVEFLLKNGLDVNLKTNKVWSIIHDDDIYHAHERILVLLLKNKANANLQNNMGKTPLYVAISAAGLSCKIASNDGTNEDSGFGDAIELLIRNGVNIPNQDGWSPLHQAIEDGCEKIVEILLRYGANVNMKNKNNDTANDLANRNGNRKIIELLSTVHPMRPSENACLQYSTDRILTGELVPDDIKPWIFVFAKQHFENRILNGELAENNEFPWMAALVYFNEDYKVSFDCGGTIISNKFVLTAAHCVTSRRRPILVRIGKVSLRNGNNDVIKATNHHIEEIISNPRYNSLKKVNDISLIRVKNTIQFSIYIKPACLQTNLDDIPSHVKLTVTGWGTTSAERNVQSDTLLKTNLITMTLSECNSTMMEWNRVPNLPPYRNGLIEGQYCAHDPKGKNDSCYGDSGGPLQYFPNNKTSVATVVGIVSFGQSCGILLPSIYTRVAYYLDWIEGIVWPNV